MFPKVLIIVSFISITVVTMATTVSTFMLYQITFMGKVMITKRFLAL